MKKIFLIILLSFGLISASFGDYRDDFPDETICIFLTKKPVNPYYIDAAKKRGITCSGGNVISKTKASQIEVVYDEIDSNYEDMTDEPDTTVPKDVCSETSKTRITTEEYLSESKSFIELKKYVIDVSLQNAFQQVNGSELRNFESKGVIDENGEQDYNFNQASYSKYEGLIHSYEVVSQEILDLGSGVKVLSVVIDATICIKDKNAKTKDVLLVGDFKYKNSSLPALKSEIEAVFSKQSKSFELTYGNPRDNYHDVLITGRIEEITKVQVIDKKATEEARKAAQKKRDEAAGDAAFFSILTAISNNKGSGNSQAVFNDISNTMNSINSQQVEIRMPEITTTVVKIFVSISAFNKSNKKTYTATATSEEKISGSGYDVSSLAIRAVKTAAKDLYAKLR